MKGYNITLLLFCFLFSFETCFTQIVFYNVENLFDTINNPNTLDDEFTPSGFKNWNKKKYEKKIKNLAKVLKIIGGFESPEIIGLCEVENIDVIKKLISNPALKKFNYDIVHRDSPDKRGIDVALIYRKDIFKIQFSQWHKIDLPYKRKYTRDILYCRGVLKGVDTIHFFVNHWPSRWGGKIKSEPKRMFVSNIIKHKIDSILNINSQANIIAMGDFNDEPKDLSLQNLVRENKLFNIHKDDDKGTYKFRAKWSKLDHFFVSKSVLKHLHQPNTVIFDESFLLEKDQKYKGKKVKRSFIGMKFNYSGFSDHLPIYIKWNSNSDI
ncbi:endonuclease/exonuclease/phosphatase family protein [Ichthyobacterium seriolicida]|uniref:Endonuclease n=1 Tax=Ichthyobacterium seriolicida TaxID=242600 RepID=A0A1J1E0K0_9FLAO|nr:endonuclease/exonuclease/phosphatase family protein [Ichthyobacterium seriolicida]BAV94461.1 endonuclease [Ichthyobacterium seriolicida]